MIALITNARRLWAQILVGCLVKAVPFQDGNTLMAITPLIDAMDRDARNG